MTTGQSKNTIAVKTIFHQKHVISHGEDEKNVLNVAGILPGDTLQFVAICVSYLTGLVILK
jgi:hypothetical protein